MGVAPNWTDADKELLTQLFNEGLSDQEIGAKLNPTRTTTAVHIRRQMLGLKRFAGPYATLWQPQEIAIIKKGLKRGWKYTQMAKKLPGRTLVQVREYAINRLNAPPRNKRWTPEEDDALTKKFLAYEPVNEISDDLKRDVGTVRQRILRLELKREARRSRLVRRFKSVATDARPVDEIVAEIQVQEAQEKAARTAEKQAQIAEALRMMKYAIDLGASRRPAFQAAMVAGSTLQEIGDVFGITRERVRQVVHGVTSHDQLSRLANRLLKLNDRDYNYLLEFVANERQEAHDSPDIS